MSAVVSGMDPIELRELLLTAHDRMADLMVRGDKTIKELRPLGGKPDYSIFDAAHPAFTDTGSIRLCMDLRDAAERVMPGQAQTTNRTTEGNEYE